MQEGLHISIKAETLFHIMGFPVTNSLLTSLAALLVISAMGLYYKSQLESKKRGRFFYFIHFLVSYLHTFFVSVLGDKINVFFPFLASIFFYVLFQNWIGLLPGVGSILVGVQEGHEIVHVPLFRGNSADLNSTLALALIAFFAIQYYGIKYQGISYFKKFIDLRNPIAFFTGILELISEFSKIISFSFRLFGNIFAGEVLLLVIAFLVPVLATFPFLMLEVFVGLVQALVFSMLTAVFISMAIQKSH